ncbi:MAG TPA: hypothetical protein PKN29_13620 [Candidatus Ozemobacteraceae bacterium]|nr:hypothetical protein [Candidatus Ozemobacteraceae bacterium]
MKKLLLPVLLGLVCAPLSADPDLQEFVRDLGYCDEYISENLPAPKARPKIAPKKQQPVHAAPQRDLMQPEDLLHPRVFQKGESAAMIPVLMRLHRANPTSDKITRKLAVTCLKNGQQREALYWYTQTYQRDRSDFESLWNMASLSYSLGETAQTKKYLEEYARLDPNSAWGRMAREFLAGRFSGADLGDGFQKGLGRVGEPAGGVSGKKAATAAPAVSGKSAETGDGILIVEGKRYDVESFVSFYDENTEIEKPTKLKDTLKGKSGTGTSDKKAGKKLSLEKAVVAEKVETGAKAPPAAEASNKAAPIESAELKATAPPLTPPVASETK